MALFTSRLDYALRALLDLSVQAPGRPAQSREIAARQGIPESYLNQLLVLLRRAGIVGSVRGAAGGYVLGRAPRAIAVADVVEALHGEAYLGETPPAPAGGAGRAEWVTRNLRNRLNALVREELRRTSLEELAADLHRLDDAQSLMLGL